MKNRIISQLSPNQTVGVILQSNLRPIILAGQKSVNITFDGFKLAPVDFFANINSGDDLAAAFDGGIEINKIEYNGNGQIVLDASTVNAFAGLHALTLVNPYGDIVRNLEAVEVKPLTSHALVIVSPSVVPIGKNSIDIAISGIITDQNAFYNQQVMKDGAQIKIGGGITINSVKITPEGLLLLNISTQKARVGTFNITFIDQENKKLTGFQVISISE
jgi:hypothetical protein